MFARCSRRRGKHSCSEESKTSACLGGALLFEVSDAPAFAFFTEERGVQQYTRIYPPPLLLVSSLSLSVSHHSEVWEVDSDEVLQLLGCSDAELGAQGVEQQLEAVPPGVLVPRDGPPFEGGLVPRVVWLR